MSKINNIANNWVTLTITALISKYDEMGLRASGKYASSLSPIIRDVPGKLTVIIEAAKHAYYMEHGTVAQSNPSPDAAKKLYPIILQWIEDKGLGFDKGRAFAICLSIVYKGVKVPNQHNTGGVISSVITKKRISELTKGLGMILSKNIKSDVIKIFR